MWRRKRACGWMLSGLRGKDGVNGVFEML